MMNSVTVKLSFMINTKIANKLTAAKARKLLSLVSQQFYLVDMCDI